MRFADHVDVPDCFISSSAAALEALGVDSTTDVHCARAIKYITPLREENWNKWVDKLQKYRARHGDCNVTKDNCDDENFYMWVRETNCVPE